MSESHLASAKVYHTENAGIMSILDMLAFFEEKGAMRVSDLHLKVGVAPTFRIDGNLVKLKGEPLTAELAEQLIHPLMSGDNLQRLKSHQSVDCSYRYGNLQFRINIFQENDGLAAAIRALSMDVPEVEKVGFPNDIWQSIIQRTHGLVLITGITGAGKSTTIASLINRIGQMRSSRIITLEDPIEYVLAQQNSVISQREVGRDVPTFTAGLKEMMREDPDIIFVGEMRDAETIAMTLMAAETGHLVFSTLHTRNAIGTVTRILDYFPEGRQVEVRNQLSLSLACIVSQKLVPCADGSGRVVAMEILNNNYAVSNLIRTGKTEQIYTQLQTKTRNQPDQMMIPLENHLVRLIRQGRITENEARKWANDVKVFDDAMQRLFD